MDTVKIAAIAGAVAYGFATWVASSTLDPAGPVGRLAGEFGRGGDPITTGSIGSAAASLRLDPCSARRP